MNSLISIIIPIYNVEEYLKKCIDSVLSQSYNNIEVILVDDGSPDRCGEICDSYNKEERVKVIHRKNGGLSAARNSGIEIATGEYLGFVDSDDYIEPIMFEYLMRSIIKYESDIAICGYRTFGDNTNIEQRYSESLTEKDTAIKDLLVNNIQSFAWNKLYSKKLFSSLRFPEGERYEDIRVMHKCFMQANKISYAEGVLYNYNVRETSITGNTKWKNSSEFKKSLEARCADLDGTSYYPYAKYGEFRSIRRIVYEMMNGELQNREYISEQIEWEKEVLQQCKSILTKKERILAELFIGYPKLYVFLRNMIGR